MINNDFERVRQEAAVAYLNSNYGNFPQKISNSTNALRTTTFRVKILNFGPTR